MSVAERQLTLEEFLKLPETKPASEFWEGRVTQKVSPKAKHSTLQGEWVQHLNRHARRARPGMAFPELRCTFAGRSIVPDVVYVRWSRIPRDASGEVADEFMLAPDLVIEILSPGQDASDLVEKLTFCIQNGVQLGWLVDPEKKRVMVFRPDRAPETLSEGVLDASPVVPGFTCRLDEMFGWLILPR